jgi:hypothetical protein
MTFKVIIQFMRNLCLYNVDILEKFNRLGVKKKNKAEKDYLEILR